MSPESRLGPGTNMVTLFPVLCTGKGWEIAPRISFTLACLEVETHFCLLQGCRRRTDPCQLSSAKPSIPIAFHPRKPSAHPSPHGQSSGSFLPSCKKPRTTRTPPARILTRMCGEGCATHDAPAPQPGTRRYWRP